MLEHDRAQHFVLERSDSTSDTQCHPERKREAPKSKNLKHFKNVQVFNLDVFIVYFHSYEAISST